MSAWEQHTQALETMKVNTALKGPAYVSVFASKPSWTLPDGTVKGWRVLIEQEHEKPFWITTYYKELTIPGKKEVAYSQNARGERIIKPYGRSN